MVELIAKDEVYAIIGAAMEVYNRLGSGFLEPVYQEALGIEFAYRVIPFCAQHEIEIIYRGRPLKKTYIADFLCFDKIIVEIKALNNLTSREEAQILNYLKATGCQVGVLINFGAHPSLEWKRIVLTKNSHPRHLHENEPEYHIEISSNG
ncbi:MAG: GxxExxY protein [Anaerolineales bacterium]